MTGASYGDDPNSASLVRSWRVNAVLWSSAVRGGKIASRKSVTDAAILAAVLRHRPERMLDLGCGEGWLCRALGPDVLFCTGIDASPELVEIAQAGGGATYITLSYADLILNPMVAGAGFDIVVANFSLLDQSTEALVAAIGQAVKPGGRLVIQTVHPFSVGAEYRTAWRTERFEAFGAESWEPMPWLFRTLENWTSVFGATWRLERIEEPVMPGAAWPASLIMTATKCA